MVFKTQILLKKPFHERHSVIFSLVEINFGLTLINVHLDIIVAKPMLQFLFRHALYCIRVIVIYRIYKLILVAVDESHFKRLGVSSKLVLKIACLNSTRINTKGLAVITKDSLV